MSNQDWLPRNLGTLQPIIKPKGIDDVPIVTLALFAKDATAGPADLERVAHALETELKRVRGTREVETIGGPRRAINIRLDPARMNASGVTVAEIRNALLSANNGSPIGEINSDNRAVLIDAGPFFRDARDIGSMIVATRGGAPVFLEQVATLDDGPPLPEQYVWYGTSGKDGHESAAVVVAVTKKPGQNAVQVADALIARLDSLRNTVIPPNVMVEVTRNYGATANDKALKLIQKLAFATLSVVILVLVALGRREAVIVGTAVILTLAATLFASWAWGFTLNRVSLFALIFSIGILVDDAIVVVENIHRHRQIEPDRALVGHHSPGRRRGRRSDDPRDADSNRCPVADGLCLRPDGAVHEPDSHQREHGHADFARHCLRHYAMARADPARQSACPVTHPAPRHRGWERLSNASSRHSWTTPRAGAIDFGFGLASRR